MPSLTGDAGSEGTRKHDATKVLSYLYTDTLPSTILFMCIINQTTKFQVDTKKVTDQIQDLESENINVKPWQLIGEVS
jgi:hypothetical protein